MVPDAIVELDRHLIEIQSCLEGGGQESVVSNGVSNNIVSNNSSSNVSSVVSNNVSSNVVSNNSSSNATSSHQVRVSSSSFAPRGSVSGLSAVRRNITQSSVSSQCDTKKRSLADVLSILQKKPSDEHQHRQHQVVSSDVEEEKREEEEEEEEKQRPLKIQSFSSAKTIALESPHSQQRGVSLAPSFSSEEIVFPSVSDLAKAPRVLRVRIPMQFASVVEYCKVYSSAVKESLYIQLCRAAEPLYAALSGGDAALRAARVECFSHCVLSCREWKGKQGRINKSLRLELPGGWQPRSRGDHQKDDLWALSLSGRFDDAVLVRSVFHGVSRDNSLAFELLPGQRKPIAQGGATSCSVNPAFQGASNVWAFRLVNASTDMQHLAALSSFGEADPLVNSIVLPSRPVKSSVKLPLFPPALPLISSSICESEERIAKSFKLNAEQREVLHRVAGWFTEETRHNITLVHGVFGSGKSTLLVAIILFLVELMEKSEACENGTTFVPFPLESKTMVAVDENQQGRSTRAVRSTPPPFRIALSSTTNTAVDRVLEGLLDVGYQDFLRVGSLRRMSRRVMPFTLYEEEKDAMHELRQMLRDDELVGADRVDVEKELEELRSGRASKRKERLGVCPVVGTTCSASTFRLFNGHTFEVLLLDECSQMVEPSSLLPLKAFLSRRVVAVGDPMQLAPPLPSEGPGTRDLSLTLFSRLASFYVPVMLRTQYRCHPEIAALASKLFYQNQLSSGISAEQRPEVLMNVAPLFFLDTAGIGQDVRDSNGSFVNEMLSHMCARFIRLSAGRQWPSRDALSSRCCVVCMFRAQARHLRATFAREEILSSIRVATVDSFQGAEMDVVVVAAGLGGSDASFVGDARRLCVTLTRARHHCVIIGDKNALKRSCKEWSDIVTSCKIVDAAEFLMEG